MTAAAVADRFGADPFDRMAAASSFDEYVAAVDDLANMSFADAEVMFRELEAEGRQLEAKRAALLAVLEDRKQYRQDGHSSVFGYLRSSVHWSEAECRSRTKLSRLIAAQPDVGESLWDARISVANADSIARLHANPRIGERFEHALGHLLRQAEMREHDDFRLLPERLQLIADREERRQRADAHERRNVQFTAGVGGGRMDVQWGDLDFAKALEVVDRFAEAEFDVDWQKAKQQFGEKVSVELLERTEAQRRADAVAKIFERACSTPAGSKAPKALATVLVDVNTVNELMAEAGLFPERFEADPFDDPTPFVAGMRCDTVDGVTINPDEVFRILLEGYVKFVFLNEHGAPVSMSRERRLFEGTAREAVLCLSGRCVHPGCRVKASLTEIDHMVPWSEVPTTSPDNGAPLCGKHNRQKSKRRWRIIRNSQGQFQTFRPDGTELR